ncbi:MAG: hypothetical protein ACLSG9_01635 [Eubacterium sp.]
MLGDVMFYGKGAGKEATASAVVSDVVDAVKHMNVNVMTIWEDEKQEVSSDGRNGKPFLCPHWKRRERESRKTL